MCRVKSLAPIINPQSIVLILGSGVQSLTQQQYYANPKNHFWQLLFTIFDMDPIDEYEAKVKFLQDKRVALWDVLQYCDRQGSLDSDIRNEVPNDFVSFLDNYPQIKHVLFNGTKARKSFEKHFQPKSFKNINFYLLPSSSPTPGKNVKNFTEKIPDWTIIKGLLVE